MALRINQGQQKKKIIVSSEEKIPLKVSEDIKDLFQYYDQSNSGVINFNQIKAILHYITGGIMKRKVLENIIVELTQKNSNFEFQDLEKLAKKLWEDVGKAQNQLEINNILKSIEPYNKDNMENLLKSKLLN